MVVITGQHYGAAASRENKEIVSLLLDRGADINAVGGDYGTALGAAAFTGEEKIVSLLLDRGADINAVGGKYGTALGVAAFTGEEKIVALLLDRGADISTVDGNVLFHSAIWKIGQWNVPLANGALFTVGTIHSAITHRPTLARTIQQSLMNGTTHSPIGALLVTYMHC